MRCLGSRCTHPCRPAPAAQLTVHGAPRAAHSVQHAVQATLNITAACAVRRRPAEEQRLRTATPDGIRRCAQSSGCRTQSANTKRVSHAPLRRANTHGMRHATPTARRARNAEGNGGSRAAVNGGRSVFGLARRNLGYDEFSALDRVRCEKLVRLGRIEQLRVVAQLAAQHATWRSHWANQNKGEERGNLLLENSAARACARLVRDGARSTAASEPAAHIRVRVSKRRIPPGRETKRAAPTQHSLCNGASRSA